MARRRGDGGDEDYAACRAAPNVVWLGEQPDEQAARLILCADVGIVPFKVEPFNDAGLPYRILKYARLGRRTVAPPLAGVATWSEAVTTAADPDAWVAALRAAAGTRSDPDTGAARVGARADRRAPERAAVGAAARARDRQRGSGHAAYALRRRTRTTGAKPGSGTLVSGLAPSANP